MGIFNRIESWHICWVAKIPGQELTYGDGTYGFRGGLTKSRIPELREALAADTSEAAEIHVEPSQINITSMAKIKSGLSFAAWVHHTGRRLS